MILNWNGKHLLEQFLPGIIEHTPNDVEIVIADNASQDDSVDFLEKNFPEVRRILLSENYGYAGGYNKALQQVDADFFVLLNSDMEVSNSWIEPCIELMTKNPEIAAIQPKIRSLINKDYFEYAGGAGGFLDIFGYPFCRGRIFDTVEKDTGQYDDPGEIFWASGAALFIRASAFRQAGGFDESFFAHMEEVDLCWRLQTMGHKVMYCGKSIVFHLGGGSLPKTNPTKTFLNFRNSLWLLAKNLPGKYFCFLIVPRLLMDVLAAIVFLFQGKTRDGLAVFKALAAFGQTWFRIRKSNKSMRRIIPRLLYRRSIVIDYYLLRKKRFSQLIFNASIAKR